MQTTVKRRNSWAVAAAAMALPLIAVTPTWGAEDLAGDYQFGVNRRAQETVLARIVSMPHTLKDAVRAVEEEGEAVTLAKFEVDGRGDIYLSIYTSAKGLNRDAENNVLKEYKGEVTRNGTWRPEVEVFDDAKHAARAAEYYVLIQLSPFSIRDIVTQAEDEGEKVLWVQPRVIRGRPIFDVGIARDGAVTTVTYDLLKGDKRRFED